jgi:hypothetical protein
MRSWVALTDAGILMTESNRVEVMVCSVRDNELTARDEDSWMNESIKGHFNGPLRGREKSTRRCVMPREINNVHLEDQMESRVGQDFPIPQGLSELERLMWNVNLFTARVNLLLVDTEKNLNDTIEQEMVGEENNLWQAIANTPRRLRPRLGRNAA